MKQFAPFLAHFYQECYCFYVMYFLHYLDCMSHYPDLYQLFFDKQLPFEALQGGRCIKCRYCGKPIIRIKEDEADLRIKRGFLNDSKCVFSTGDVLTGEILGFSTYSINIVPRDFYLFCMKSKINKGLLFNPVMLID